MKKAVCFRQDSHQASVHDGRMRRERLIQPTKPAPIVGMISIASAASGICAQMPYPPKNIKPAIMRFRDNRSRPSLPAAQKITAADRFNVFLQRFAIEPFLYCQEAFYQIVLVADKQQPHIQLSGVGDAQ